MKKKPSYNNSIINFYEHKDVKKLLTEYHNPHFDETQIKLPFRLGLVGSSSSGKTQILLNYIAKANDTFGQIIVCCKMRDEPLYAFLEKKISAKYIKFYTSLAELPSPNELGKEYGDKQILMIFDDMVNEKNQEIIKEYFIRGRKIAGGISMVYISQDFFKIPTLVRRQFNYLMLLKLSSLRDLNLILSDFSLGVDKKLLQLLYKDATKVRGEFLKIDVDNPEMNLKFSHNWTDFYPIE